MSLSLLLRQTVYLHLVLPLPIRFISFTRMPKTRLFSMQQNPLLQNPTGSEVGGIVPKKRVRRRLEMKEKVVKMETPDEKFLSHPEIEDLAHKSDNIYSQSIQPPANWEKVVDRIRGMRSSEHAPVDSIDPEEGVSSLQPKERRFAALVGSLLSSQTKGHVTHEATQRLLENGLLSADTMDKADEVTIKSLIYPVGFYTRKARNLKQVAKICLSKYDGDIPSTVEELLLLPGVGPKIAHLVMHMAWNKVEGICVDTHVHRICNRLGWVSQPGKEQMEINEKPKHSDLTLTLVRELDPLKRLGSRWSSGFLKKNGFPSICFCFVAMAFKFVQVGFGQTICTPVRPRCAKCTASEFCPSAFKEISSPAPTPRKLSPKKKLSQGCLLPGSSKDS